MKDKQYYKKYLKQHDLVLDTAHKIKRELCTEVNVGLRKELLGRRVTFEHYFKKHYATIIDAKVTSGFICITLKCDDENPKTSMQLSLDYVDFI